MAEFFAFLKEIRIWFYLYILLVVWVVIYFHLIEQAISDDYMYRFGKIRKRRVVYKRLQSYVLPALVTIDLYVALNISKPWLLIAITTYIALYILLIIFDYMNEIRYGLKHDYIKKIHHIYKVRSNKPTIHVKHFPKIYIFFYLVMFFTLIALAK